MLPEIDNKEFLKLIRMELARRDFWEYCKFIAPDFYTEQRPFLQDLCSTLQRFCEDDSKKILVVNMPPRHGKLVADYEPVLTRRGWKRHGDLTTDDYVIAPDGRFARVTHVHPKHHATHRVTFSNGQTIDCHHNHEWVVVDRRGDKENTVETNYLIDKLVDIEGNKKRHRFHLPHVQPLHGEEKNLTVSPYVLGVWLGDGDNRSNRICSSDEDIAVLEECETHYQVTSRHKHSTTGVNYWYFRGLRQVLHEYGMCVYNKTTEKYIPEAYLTASLEQRLELLAGLLDTDGYLRKNEHRYIFSTTEERLKDTFIELIATFGWRTSVTRTKAQTSSSCVHGKKDVWQIGFNPTFYIPCRLPRKQLHRYSEQRKIAITSIEPLEEPVSGNCITVEGGVYLVGKTLIPTHNSRTATLLVQWLFGRNPYERVMTGSYNETLSSTFARQVRDKILEEPTKGVTVYRDIFPNTQIKKGEASASKWALSCSEQTSYLATSPSGTATGFGCSIMLLDDLLKNAEEAYNELTLQKHIDWFNNTMLSRTETGFKMIIIMTRWATGDLAGYILENFDDVEHINYKAVQDDGSMLCEEILTKDDYEFKVKNMNPDIVAANYQQEPIDVKGRLYSSFKTYTGALPDFREVRNYTDTADTGDDYLCSINYGVTMDKEVYVLDVLYTKAPMEVTEPTLARMLVRDNVNIADIESNNGGRGFSRAVERIVRNELGSNYTLFKPFTQRKNKQSRILTNATWVMEHVYFPKNWGERWRDYYLAMTKYQREGKNAHDDAPDATTGIAEKVGQKARISFD